jgi:hypothetical protein
MKIFSIFKHFDCGNEEKILSIFKHFTSGKKASFEHCSWKKISSDFLEIKENIFLKKKRAPVFENTVTQKKKIQAPKYNC